MKRRWTDLLYLFLYYLRQIAINSICFNNLNTDDLHTLSSTNKVIAVAFAIYTNNLNQYTKTQETQIPDSVKSQPAL